MTFIPCQQCGATMDYCTLTNDPDFEYHFYSCPNCGFEKPIKVVEK